jgi:hypothetical protein
MNESDVSQLSWIRALDPIRPPYRKRLSSHSDLEVWHVDVEFEQWRIPAEMADRWQDSRTDSHETWRKRPLARGTASGCPYSCAEVELAARLRSGGLEAYWVSEWSGFPHVPCWKPFCVKRSEMGSRLPQVLAYDQRLRTTSPEGESLGRGGGHPDIVAWGPGDRDFVFLEYKGPGDSIKPKQNAWARAAVRDAGVRVNYVAVNGIFRDRSEELRSAPEGFHWLRPRRAGRSSKPRRAPVTAAMAAARLRSQLHGSAASRGSGTGGG